VDSDQQKRNAGQRAAKLIESGMRVGLGTGSTVFYFVEALIERCRGGLEIQAVASSEKTLELARAGGIPILKAFDALDITVDGADEIDSMNRMIKGGGGALLREKILAFNTSRMVVIVDESKCVDKLGRAKLPLEILPFGHLATANNIPYKGEFRKSGNELFITDNGNYIYDVYFEKPLDDPENIDRELREIPGVLETGFFFGLVDELIVGVK